MRANVQGLRDEFHPRILGQRKHKHCRQYDSPRTCLLVPIPAMRATHGIFLGTKANATAMSVKKAIAKMAVEKSYVVTNPGVRPAHTGTNSSGNW